eukprot:TRINITY_DN2045_c0_g1_i1.p1 TRINITY_DN2045_c0_g1~~TRINITY_DN2045_c0_g1_i1.p1  ORF type:complete len:423 (-),score=80.95 TRINITY_DN2045_c0_g1_i1:100-1251(-)
MDRRHTFFCKELQKRLFMPLNADERARVPMALREKGIDLSKDRQLYMYVGMTAKMTTEQLKRVASAALAVRNSRKQFEQASDKLERTMRKASRLRAEDGTCGDAAVQKEAVAGVKEIEERYQGVVEACAAAITVCKELHELCGRARSTSKFTINMATGDTPADAEEPVSGAGPAVLESASMSAMSIDVAAARKLKSIDDTISVDGLVWLTELVDCYFHHFEDSRFWSGHTQARTLGLVSELQLVLSASEDSGSGNASPAIASSDSVIETPELSVTSPNQITSPVTSLASAPQIDRASEIRNMFAYKAPSKSTLKRPRVRVDDLVKWMRLVLEGGRTQYSRHDCMTVAEAVTVLGGIHGGWVENLNQFVRECGRSLPPHLPLGI